jgi:hypothetical protein
MKKTTTLLVALLMLINLSSSAQAFNKDTKLLSLGVGGGAFIYVFSGLTTIQPTFQVKVEAEFPVHKYVGIGVSTGVGVGGIYGATVVNIPAIAIGNFHFYQLIADKSGKSIHADKLDVYAGINLGAGLAIGTGYFGGSSLGAAVIVGPQVGARYYFTDKFGVNAEVGFGKSFLSAGVTFKLGGGKSKK